MKIEVKEKKNKKIVVGLLIMITLSIMLIIGVSYAYWQLIKIQDDSNVVATGCFDVTLTGKNPINLASAYPITSTKGMTSTPYEFTITNTCSYQTSYVVNLESLAATTFANSSIRVALNNNHKLYNAYTTGTKYYSNSKEARTLTTGTLQAKGTVTYSLRLWVDEAVTTSEVNKRFESKIIVMATPS